MFIKSSNQLVLVKIMNQSYKFYVCMLYENIFSHLVLYVWSLVFLILRHNNIRYILRGLYKMMVIFPLIKSTAIICWYLLHLAH